MAEGAREISKDFWRPTNMPRAGVDSAFAAPCCANCGAEFVLGARFCHVCGAPRETLTEQRPRWMEWLEVDTVCQRLGLNLAALVLLALACACALGALLAGVIYRVDTIADWQAVQTWRIEWMLGAAVLLLGALLLKKPAA